MLRTLFGKSITYKLTALLSLVVVITLGIVLCLYIYFEKDFAHDTSAYQFSLATRTINELLSYTNGKEHNLSPQQIIEEVDEASGVNYITLYDNNGRPVISSTPSRQAPLKEKDLTQLQDLSYDHYISSMSEKTLDYIAPVRLVAGCQKCHHNGDRLGFVKVSVYYSQIYKHTYAMAKKLGLIFVSIFFIFGVISIFISETMVVRPLKGFLELIHKAEANNFLPRAEQNRKDEIGEIENNFNQMLSRITKLMAASVERERELVFAKEELRYKKILEKRSEQIEEMNKELGESVKELSLLYNFGQYIISTVDMNELLRIITTTIVDTLHYKECAILFREDNILRIVSAWGFEDNIKLIGMEFGLDEGISGQVASTGKPMLINDTSNEVGYLHYKGQKRTEGSFLSLPLKYKNNVIGVLNVGNDVPNSLTRKDMDFLSAICAQIAVVIENTRLYAQTKELSITDDLTGLFNRRHMRVVLDKEWERAKRYSQPLSLLMIDVDLFKEYNDKFGHLKGDEALGTLSQIFKTHIRGIDTTIRYGGEEFIIILPDTNADGAMIVAEKLRKATVEAFKQDGTIILTVSIGFVSYPDEMFDNANEFLYASDIALYEAKKQGRNTIIKYDSKSMQENDT